jgi:hypothetical protein
LSLELLVIGLMLFAGVWSARWGEASATFSGLGMLVAFHLSGCIGDFAMVAMVARQPRDTTIEDLPNGVRFHAAN